MWKKNCVWPFCNSVAYARMSLFNRLCFCKYSVIRITQHKYEQTVKSSKYCRASEVRVFSSNCFFQILFLLVQQVIGWGYIFLCSLFSFRFSNKVIFVTNLVLALGWHAVITNSFKQISGHVRMATQSIKAMWLPVFCFLLLMESIQYLINNL